MEDRQARRVSLKTRHPDWKDKLWQSCLKRVQDDRAHLLWKFRSIEKVSPNEKGIVESALRDIITDELEKMKQSSTDDCSEISVSGANDSLWEYDGLHIVSGVESNCIELLIEMEKALQEDLKAEQIRRELEFIERTLEEEENYLSQAVYEQMKLSDDQVCKDKAIWCPICKRGELREDSCLIYCTCCELQIDVQSDKVKLDFLQLRLAEVHVEHLDRGCKSTPKFCMDTRFGLTALCIECQTCNTFEIVV